jgi:hypothetical protein
MPRPLDAPDARLPLHEFLDPDEPAHGRRRVNAFGASGSIDAGTEAGELVASLPAMAALTRRASASV